MPKLHTRFYFGYDGGFGFITMLENPHTGEVWVCRAAPNTPYAVIASVHQMSRTEVPCYTFSFEPQPKSEVVGVYAHPFALPHLYAAGMMDQKEVMEIGARTSRDTFLLQHPVETPCLLNEQLQNSNVTLVLSARYDLRVA